MTFWDAFAKGFEWITGRITRILAVATGTLVTLTGTGIIPDAQLKYWMAVIAILTYWRGQATGATYNQAKAIVALSTTGVPNVNAEPDTRSSSTLPDSRHPGL